MKITKEQLKQIIKEELESIPGYEDSRPKWHEDPNNSRTKARQWFAGAMAGGELEGLSKQQVVDLIKKKFSVDLSAEVAEDPRIPEIPANLGESERSTPEAIESVSEVFAKVENLIGSAHEEITALKDYERTSKLTPDMTRNAKRIGYSIILMQAYLESFLGLEEGGMKDYVGPLHRVTEQRVKK